MCIPASILTNDLKLRKASGVIHLLQQLCEKYFISVLSQLLTLLEAKAFI